MWRPAFPMLVAMLVVAALVLQATPATAAVLQKPPAPPAPRHQHSGTTSTLTIALNATAAALAPALSPALFGLNLEFTRHDLFNGLSAQRLANRVFALQVGDWNRTGALPPRWQVAAGQPHAAGPFQALACPLAGPGDACAVRQTGVGSGFDSGLGAGSAITLQRGTAYVLEVALRCAGCSPGVRLDVDINGVFSAAAAVAAGDANSTQVLVFPFTANVTQTNATLTLGVGGGTGTVVFNATSLLPAANSNSSGGGAEVAELREDVLGALGALGFAGPLRYPGGCFTPFWRWEDGLQPRLTRPPIFTPAAYCAAVPGGVNGYTDGMMENGLDVDVYMQVVRRLGVEPAITLPLQFGTPAELQSAANLVEYCNGDASSTVWGRRRAARGWPQPYNVSRWYLGNEMNLQLRYADYPASGAAQGPPTAAEYAHMAAALAAAVRAVDPHVQLLAVEGGTAWDEAWVGAGNVSATATSFHGGYATASPVLPAQYTAAAKMAGAALASKLQALRATLDAAGPGGKAVGISADEWGLGPPWVVRKFDAAHAIFGGSFLTTVLGKVGRDAGVVLSNYFEPINEGALEVGPFAATLTSLGQIMRVFARHAGLRGVEVAAGFTPGSDDDVAVLAGLGGGRVVVTLTNRHAMSGYDVEVEVAVEMQGGGVMHCAGETWAKEVGWVSPQLVQSAGDVPAESTGGGFRFEVHAPAYSVVQVVCTAKK